MSQLILEQETHRVLGAGFEVYKEKGCGRVEPVMATVALALLILNTRDAPPPCSAPSWQPASRHQTGALKFAS
jgi:hypothetical protein